MKTLESISFVSGLLAAIVSLLPAPGSLPEEKAERETAATVSTVDPPVEKEAPRRTETDGTVPLGETPEPPDYLQRLKDTAIVDPTSFYDPVEIEGGYVIAGYHWRLKNDREWSLANPPEIVRMAVEYRIIWFSVVNSGTYFRSSEIPRWSDYQQVRTFIAENPEVTLAIRKMEAQFIPVRHIVRALNDPNRRVRKWANEVIQFQRRN